MTASSFFRKIENRIYSRIPFSKETVLFIFFGIILLACCRICFVFWQWDRARATHEIFSVLAIGTRVDLAMLSAFVFPVLFLSILTAFIEQTSGARLIEKTVQAWFVFVLTVICAMEALTPSLVSLKVETTAFRR